MAVDVSSPYYPYERVQGYQTLPLLEDLPYTVRDYLMDMPSKGYTPPDNNDYPRCRIAKMLYWDDPLPLQKPLPTVAQKLSIVYDPLHPGNAPTDKGYRVFSQFLVPEAQLYGQTVLKIYVARIKSTNAYTGEVAVNFDVLANAAYDANTRTTALSRTLAIASDIQRSLSGVNFPMGVGTWYFDRTRMTDVGLQMITDEVQNVGYRLTMGISFTGAENYTDQ